MINTSDTRRLVEKSLANAIYARIKESPDKDPDTVMKLSLAELISILKESTK